MDENVGGRPVRVGDVFQLRREGTVRVVREVRRTSNGWPRYVMQVAVGTGPRTGVSLSTLRKDYVRAEDQRAEREANIEHPPVGYDESTHG